jgi:hypothetical protein
MFLIEGLTEDAKQTQMVIIPSGESFKLDISYFPMQIGWFMNVTYKDFSVTNIRIVTSPNILHQFSNLIPFGLACLTSDSEEPLLQQDFSSSRAKLYLLGLSDLAAFESYLSG